MTHAATPTATSNSATAVLQQRYALAHQQPGGAAARVVLHLGEQQCGVAVGSGREADLLQLLPLGLERTAAQQFRTNPPTPLAMENAIMVVEDAVMPLHAHMPPDAQLFSADAVVRDIAQVCGVPAQAPMVLSLEALERGFNRLCNVVAGTPAAHEGLPADNRFAMALLILREFMHHLQLTHVTVLQDPPA